MKNRFRNMLFLSVSFGVFTLVITCVAVLVSQGIGIKSGEPNYELSAFFCIVALIFGAVTLLTAIDAGEEWNTGHLASKSNLKVNSIYEVVISGPIGAPDKVKGFLYVLRLQDGDLRAFNIDAVFPPIFKVVLAKDNPGEHQYLEYPRPTPVRV